MKHPFHVVELSPWPILAATSTLVIFSGAVCYMHHFTGAKILFLGLLLLISVLFCWWRDVIQEGTFEGAHTEKVQLGLRYGMILFIISEIAFFAAFFWAFFHSSITPAVQIGNVWPPLNIESFDPWQLPFVNTLILLCSGVTVTWSHHALLHDEQRDAIVGLALTIILGSVFTFLQYHEYSQATFSLASAIYGSTFYMSTGFHGIHVIIGTLFLLVCLVRLLKGHFSVEHHVGFEAAIWYWHFVDVVWLFLFSFLYWWGNGL